MEHYKDLGDDSGIEAFQIEADRIVIRFKGGKLYTYSYASAGQAHIEQMKVLARSGDGLNSYIMKYLKNSYVK